MKVILHQAQGVDLPIRLGANLTQGLEKPLPIRVIPEDGLAPIPAIHQVVNRAFVFNPQRSRHGENMPATAHLCQ
jgi:hypothetical protein